MIDRGKFNVLGVNLSAVDYEAAVQRVSEAAKHGTPMAVSALAVHGVMTGVMDSEHRYRLNQFDLLVPDGQPVRWALNNLHRTGLRERVYGPTLMLKLCERAAQEQIPIFLYGGTEEILAPLQKNLLKQFPTLQIAGSQASRFRRLSPEEGQGVVDTIRSSGAQITFIGLGCPRQEIWAYEFRDRLEMPLIAVGAAFPFHAGVLSQAPPRLQSLGLEWFYRLVHEPRRLWRRYLILNPLYCSLFAAQRLRLRSFNEACSAPTEEMLFG